MATTPPPRGARVLTPPTPLHGPMHDSPRRSSRIHTKAMHSPSALPDSPHLGRKRQARPPSSQTLSPPSSPISPKYSTHLARSRNSKSVKLQADLDPLSTIPRARNGDLEPGMLPTPHKTPRKRTANVDAPTARLLFPSTHQSNSDDLMPTPKKSRLGKKKNLALTLESFEEEASNGGSGVEIFTDSKERVPEMDETDDNPFVSRRSKRGATRQGPTEQRSSKPKYGMGKEVDAAVQNDQGMVYTFRGKKIYRPFEDGNGVESSDVDDELGGDSSELRRRAGPSAHRPLTRSSIKPRLLFPSAHADDSTDDLAAEEAETDIETPLPSADEKPAVDDEDEISAATPAKGQSFLPMTPPTTTKKTKVSPFDAWSRTKAGGKGPGGKRAGEPKEVDVSRNKRSRSAQVLE